LPGNSNSIQPTEIQPNQTIQKGNEMMKIAITLAVIMLAAGCTTPRETASSGPARIFSTAQQVIPDSVPVEAHPVWLIYYAYESDDFPLFCAAMSRETREIVQKRMGLRAAFTEGKSKQNGPLNDMTFTASHSNEHSEARLGIAFVEAKYGRSATGTRVVFEDGAWKLGHPVGRE